MKLNHSDFNKQKSDIKMFFTKENLKNSLLIQYLTRILIIVFTSFILLGMMLLLFLNQYSVFQSKKTLTDNCVAVATLISENTGIKNGDIVVDKTIYSNLVSAMAKSINANILIVNNDGKIQLTSDLYSENTDKEIKIPQSIIKKVNDGNYFETGKLGGVFSENYFVAGKPIFININGIYHQIGYVFVGSTSNAVYELSKEIIQIFGVAAISTLLISFLVIGIFTYNMVKPLLQMSKATKSFAQGDFSMRIKATSDDEIGQLAKALNDMANALAVSEGIRRSFIANISHELRTPMTTITGFIDGIRDGTIPPEKQSYYLEIVSSETKRLSRLVQSMLALARIDSENLVLQKVNFDLTNTLISTLFIFEQKIQAKNISIKGVDKIPQTYVLGDSDMIHQVIYNLIENAVKFTNQDGYIDINLLETPQSTQLSIENSGEGISPEETLHIFERFYKTDKSRSHDKNGMGLGLYIVKKIMLLHGGDINVISEYGKNCKFTIWLPKVQNNHEKTKGIKGLKGGNFVEQ